MQFSAGQRHSVYTCVDGDIVAEQGDQFRGTKGICLQNDEPQFYLAFPESDGLMERELTRQNLPVAYAGESIKYATCDVGSDGIGTRLLVTAFDYMKQSQSTSQITTGRLGLINSNNQDPLAITRQNYQNGFNNAILVDNYEFTSNCPHRELYSIATPFYPPTPGVPTPSLNRCGECGDGTFNICDDNECWPKGDCVFHGKSLNPIAGCAAGATIAWGTYYLISVLTPVGSAVGASGGSASGGIAIAEGVLPTGGVYGNVAVGGTTNIIGATAATTTTIAPAVVPAIAPAAVSGWGQASTAISGVAVGDTAIKSFVGGSDEPAPIIQETPQGDQIVGYTDPGQDYHFVAITNEGGGNGRAHLTDPNSPNNFYVPARY